MLLKAEGGGEKVYNEGARKSIVLPGCLHSSMQSNQGLRERALTPGRACCRILTTHKAPLVSRLLRGLALETARPLRRDHRARRRPLHLPSLRTPHRLLPLHY